MRPRGHQPAAQACSQALPGSAPSPTPCHRQKLWTTGAPASKTLSPALGSPNLSHPPTFVACLAFTHLDHRPGSLSKPCCVRLQPNLSFVPGRLLEGWVGVTFTLNALKLVITLFRRSVDRHTRPLICFPSQHCGQRQQITHSGPAAAFSPGNITHTRACLSRWRPSTRFSSRCSSTLSISLSTSLSTPLRQSLNGPPFPLCLKPPVAAIQARTH